MGEKGIAGDALGAVSAPAAGLVERTTTVVSSVATTTGEAVVDKLRDKSIDLAAQNVLDEARERIRERRDEGDEGEPGKLPEPPAPA